MKWSWPRIRIGARKEKVKEIRIKVRNKVRIKIRIKIRINIEIEIEIGMRIARRAKKWQAFANGGQVNRLGLGMFDPTR